MLDSINIGAVIARERRRRGMTQGDIADFVGVSKAAVSKWELGSSMPDVTMLPKLAGLFSISLEELLDYEAVLPEAAVQEVRGNFLEEFAHDANAAFEHLDTIVRLHYSSWSLLLSAASLLLAAGASSEKFIKKAAEYCERVEQGCPDEALVQQAKKLHAVLLLLLNKAEVNPDDVARLLGPLAEKNASCGPLLAEAYLIGGDTEAASEQFQHMLANGVELILASLPSLIQLMPDGNGAAIADCGVLAAQLYAHFGGEIIGPLVVLETLFTAATTSLSSGDEQGALCSFSLYATVVDDIGVSGRSYAVNAPLSSLAKCDDGESLAKLVNWGDDKRTVDGTLRILRSHLDAMSSEPWTSLEGSRGYSSAVSGTQEAIARLEQSESLAR